MEFSLPPKKEILVYAPLTTYQVSPHTNSHSPFLLPPTPTTLPCPSFLPPLTTYQVCLSIETFLPLFPPLTLPFSLLFPLLSFLHLPLPLNPLPPFSGYLQEKYYKSLLDRTIFQMMADEKKEKLNLMESRKENCIVDSSSEEQRTRRRKTVR